MLHHKANFTTALTFLSILILSACGGGGGGGSRPNVSAQNTPSKNSGVLSSEKKENSPVTSSDTDKTSNEKMPETSTQPIAPPSTADETVKSETSPVMPPSTEDDAVATDKKTFQKLSLNGINGLTGENIVKLVLQNGKEINLTLLDGDNNSFIGVPVVKTLRDSEGKLVGYTASATINKTKKNDFGEIDTIGVDTLYLQDAAVDMKKRPEGLDDIRYSGTMLYTYKQEINQPLRAQVSAVYHGMDKKVSMELISEQKPSNRWYLYDGSNKYLSKNKVDVESDGGFSGYLMFDENGTHERKQLKLEGHFNGGFYGTNGSVLTGKASGDRAKEPWEGVLGATIKPQE